MPFKIRLSRLFDCNDQCCRAFSLYSGSETVFTNLSGRRLYFLSRRVIISELKLKFQIHIVYNIVRNKNLKQIHTCCSLHFCRLLDCLLGVPPFLFT